MEMIFVFLLGFAIGEENKKQDEKIENLTEWNYRLSGEISSLSAREKVNDDLQKRQIERLIREVMNAPVAE